MALCARDHILFNASFNQFTALHNCSFIKTIAAKFNLSNPIPSEHSQARASDFGQTISSSVLKLKTVKASFDCGHSQSQTRLLRCDMINN